MDTPPFKKHSQCSESLQTLLIPNDLVLEIISLLSDKNIVQLKCVSKAWNTLISDPTFVQKHLKLSSQNPHLTLSWKGIKPDVTLVVPFPVHLLLKNPSITVSSNESHHFKNSCRVIGSCNGLVCLSFHSVRQTPTIMHLKNWFRFWNLATRTRSKDLGSLCYSTPPFIDNGSGLSYFKFSFGYDASTLTNKVVAFRIKRTKASWKSEVKIFNLSNNCWRNI